MFQATAAAFNPSAGDFSRRDPKDVRVLSWNMGRLWMDPDTQAPSDRILTAIRPDIILFQEITVDENASTITTRLNRVLPLGAGRSWSVQFSSSDGFIRNAIASSYPILMGRTNIVPAAEPRGIAVGLIDLPNSVYKTDLYVMSLHFKALGTESDELRRQASADAIIAWIRTLKNPGGIATLPIGTPILYGGDTNLRISTPISMQAQETLVTGSIFDTATYGPPSPPDWDGTDALDPFPRDPFTNSFMTFSATNPTARLDRFYFTDSVGSIPTAFVFNTATMTTSARNNAGVFSADARNTTDHLPIVVDVRLPTHQTGWMMH